MGVSGSRTGRGNGRGCGAFMFKVPLGLGGGPTPGERWVCAWAVPVGHAGSLVQLSEGALPKGGWLVPPKVWVLGAGWG